jgi:hypothetical protein
MWNVSTRAKRSQCLDNKHVWCVTPDSEDGIDAVEVSISSTTKQLNRIPQLSQVLVMKSSTRRVAEYTFHLIEDGTGKWIGPTLRIT